MRGRNAAARDPMGDTASKAGSHAPPLKALPAFEAALRLGSFAMAADELAVTPGAVSQQIRRLEDWLGVSLFVRGVRQVTPTPDGLGYYAIVRPALAQLAEASQTLRTSHSLTVRLSMPPGLAAKWFARRMQAFALRHPSIALQLSSSAALVDFQRDPIDLAIRHTDRPGDDLVYIPLFQDEARVYASPDYVQRIGMTTPADIGKATLLHNTLHPHWTRWALHFSALDSKGIEAILGTHFDQSLMAIEAAKRGQGLVLTSAILVEDELANGTLIELFDAPLSTGHCYYLTHRKMPLRRAVESLKAWLVEEAAA